MRAIFLWRRLKPAATLNAAAETRSLTPNPCLFCSLVTAHYFSAHHRHHRPALEGPAMERTVAAFRGNLTNQEIPLSPNGGEGWGEGEFCLSSAKIAKIASITASVSCNT